MIVPIDDLKGKKIYFASDFHLGVPDRPQSLERERKIIRWLDLIKHDAAHIFLMGDIFDFWFEYKHVVPKGYVRFLAKVAEITDAGISVSFFTGNHDFWMFSYFTEELGVNVFTDLQTADFRNKKFLLGHGDGLGNGDYKYKALKKFFFQVKPFQWLFDRVLPSYIGMSIANAWSLHSKLVKGSPPPFKGNDEFIWQYCKEVEATQHFDYYIFGHRHLPLNLEVGGNKDFPPSRYINIGEWIRQFTFGVFDGQEISLMTFKDDFISPYYFAD
jgi:UDP-2,3-diacylglucosamine hydrolase